jgi:hypothetical protein
MNNPRALLTRIEKLERENAARAPIRWRISEVWRNSFAARQDTPEGVAIDNPNIEWITDEGNI